WPWPGAWPSAGECPEGSEAASVGEGEGEGLGDGAGGGDGSGAGGGDGTGRATAGWGRCGAAREATPPANTTAARASTATEPSMPAAGTSRLARLSLLTHRQLPRARGRCANGTNGQYGAGARRMRPPWEPRWSRRAVPSPASFRLHWSWQARATRSPCAGSLAIRTSLLKRMEPS